MRKSRRTRLSPLAGTGVLVLATLSSCTVDATPQEGDYSDGEVVVLAISDWTGSRANAAVAAHVLERELDVEVHTRSLDQRGAWDELDNGTVHAVLEDWGGLPEQRELFTVRRGSVVEAGPLGVTGHIGWFVPRDYADEHPEALQWENLNDFADDFATPESGGKGQLLHGDPGAATHDSSLIDQLGLDYQPVPAGSEQAQVQAIREAAQDGTPLLTHWWEPHWLNSEVELVEVQLPRHRPGCQDVAEEVSCGYPKIQATKYLNASFAENGGEAAEFLREFGWNTEDQNTVARLIEAEGLTPGAAAEQWVADHPEAVARWLPAAN